MDEKNFINKEQFKKEIDDYKKFIFSSNLFSMAITLIAAQTVQKLVSIISETIFMPFVNYIINSTGGNWRNLIFIPFTGMEIELGKFLGGILEFTITITFIYIVFYKIIKKFDPNSEIKR